MRRGYEDNPNAQRITERPAAREGGNGGRAATKEEA